MKNTFTSFLLLLISFGFGLQSCKNETENQNPTKTEIQKPNDSLKSVSVEESEKMVEYAISVEEIDSLQYHSFKEKTAPIKKKITKITDINEAKKMLKGIVEFDEKNTDDEYLAIKKIHFRNGKKIGYTNEWDYFYFIAYYPEEDILLCEGGHTTDISFNLKNGKETEETGNPDVIDFSPKENFRLNGHFEGQECYAYFIQRKINNEYVKIIQLDKEFEKLTKLWLCTIGESFWADENTLYLTETEYFEDGIKSQFFKVKIVEKH
ncbi:hypothetical protein J2X31_003576 [Flavobacterium arsenatis]|uniref:Lipoprotein n=1 Tax=Flavobacterium arsenatis TaxID=1484332 RepID=A0ABU1TUK9_9FLAO|nr:hypothetical protein [Flavobacterium arsenatis]MDR6969543.1 hypothetical protein [Flavobacterium arsenatis]